MAEHARATHPRRLFTALFPDAACRETLGQLRRSWLAPGARAAPACQRLHLTLQLVRAQVWRQGHNELVVLRPQRCAPLLALQEQTAAIARQAGMAPPGRRFKPHLTLPAPGRTGAHTHPGCAHCLAHSHAVPGAPRPAAATAPLSCTAENTRHAP